ncbi:unnamed protein product, partial [Hymenolepis diminuta]
PVSTKVLLTANLIQTASHDTNLHLPVRNSVKVANFTPTMDFSIPQVVPARPVPESTTPIQQSVLKSSLRDHQTN